MVVNSLHLHESVILVELLIWQKTSPPLKLINQVSLVLLFLHELDGFTKDSDFDVLVNLAHLLQ